MTLNDILQSAQGGQALQNLGNQFGLSPDQLQSALQGIIPALSHGLQRTAQDPGALGGVISEMTNGAHADSYNDPSQTATAADAGTGALGQIFGSPQITAQIGQQISRVSGVSPQIIGSLLPAVASIVMGGLAQHAQQGQQAQGGGGLLGSLINSVEGALGAAAAGGQIQGGLGTLINMFAPGITAPAGHNQALNNILPR